MNRLGIHLTLLIGPTVPIPAPPMLTETLDSIEVSHSAETRSGFQMSFRVARSGPLDLLDYPLLTSPLLRTFNRVVLMVTFDAIPTVLFDGVITHQELSPGEGGDSTLKVTGEDVTVMMDMEEKSVEHPAQDETIIAMKIIATYAQYGMIPIVIPPAFIDSPIPTDRIPVQQGTDLEYLNEMAGRHGYEFHITPGPAPMTNTAYWGPPKFLDVPQRALSVNLGPMTNVSSIQFRNSGLAPAAVSGRVQDRTTNQALPVEMPASLRPPLSLTPAMLANQPNVRREAFREGGLTVMQSFARAQGRVNRAGDDTLTATGELDALRYGGLLKPRGLVGLRGAGFQHDGLYHVKSVTHRIGNGEYKQSFTLNREGTGSITPVVRP